MATIKVISGVSTIVGHVPFDISSVCSIFIRRGGSINSTVIGSCRYSSDLEKGGLEIPCKFVFSIGNEKEASKTRIRLEATLSIVVAMDTLSIRDTSNADADLATNNQVEFQDKPSSYPTADQATVVEVQGRAIDDQAAEVQDVTPVVDLSSDLLDEAVKYDAVSPQKKRIKLLDSERIIMGEELTDLEINLAQQLLKKQFPNLNGFTCTLLQDKKCTLMD